MNKFLIFLQQATKSGGVVVIVGLSGSTEMKIPIINALFREVDIRGIFRYTNWYVSVAMLCYFIALFHYSFSENKFSRSTSLKFCEKKILIRYYFLSIMLL